MISKKIVITGQFGVGKSSIFNRFISNTFDEKYHTTIGVRVDKRNIKVGDKEVSLIIWDMAGEVSQSKVPRSYFLGASAVIYVFDLSRPATYSRISEDIDYISNLLPGVVIRKVGNKKDLVDDETLKRVHAAVQPDSFTSAKTCENIQVLFENLAKHLIKAPGVGEEV